MHLETHEGKSEKMTYLYPDSEEGFLKLRETHLLDISCLVHLMKNHMR